MGRASSEVYIPEHTLLVGALLFETAKELSLAVMRSAELPTMP